MPPQKTLKERVDEFRSDLDSIQSQLELLKREYDLYFNGARKRQPYEMKSAIERLLRKWRSTNINKVELQFRLNGLNAKYNSMVDVWEKIIKRREIDPKALTAYGPSSSQLAAEMAVKNRAVEEHDDRAGRAAEQAATRRERPVEDPETRMRTLYNSFVDAKRDVGESSSVSYDKFRAQLDKQSSQIRSKTGVEDVQFKVVRKDGKVSLTAKPVRKSEGEGEE